MWVTYSELTGEPVLQADKEALPMAKYRKKPVVIEAEQLTELTFIHTLEGTMQGNPGDWLITGVAGERYPCKDSIFRETYEPVEEDNTNG